MVNAIQGNWQVSLAAMNWHVSGEESPDSSLMAGVLFSFTSFFVDLQYIYGIYKVYRKATQVKEELMVEPEDDEKTRLQGLHRQLKLKGALAMGLLGVYCFFMVWTLLKVLALGFCPDHMWNFG